MKHICIFFIYNNLEHIIKSFESIQDPNVDYFIIENKSDNSSKIQEYFFTKNLKGYIQFEENISNNAMDVDDDMGGGRYKKRRSKRRQSKKRRYTKRRKHSKRRRNSRRR